MRFIQHPILCNYYLTYRCNAACSFCDIWEKPSPYADRETLVRNLVSLKKLGVKVIDYTGGEPLLHSDLPYFLEKAKELGFITTVTTNGLLYPKRAKSLAGKVDMLHFSLDSIHEKKHNQSRKVDCFSFVQESLALAKQLGERPDILFTLTEDNIEEIPELYAQYYQKEGFNLILNPIFEYAGLGSSLSESTLKALKVWCHKPGVYLNEAFLDLRLNGGNDISAPVCRAASTTIVISPENKLVMPCYHLGIKELEIGEDLAALWKSKAVQDWVVQEGKLPGCAACTVNCYMEPSFSVEWGPYFRKSLPSTLAYALNRWVYA